MKIAVEQVSKYHPDKYADAIANAIVRNIIHDDPNAHCGIEVMVKDTTVVVGGEVKSSVTNKKLKVLIQGGVMYEATNLNYKVTKIINLVGKQSPQIDKAVMSDEKFGAGDQGIVTGYANVLDITYDTSRHMNKYFAKLLADKIIDTLENNIEVHTYTILKGDAKTLVIFDTDKNAVSKVVLSMCHKDDVSFDAVKALGSTIVYASLLRLADGGDISKVVTPDFELQINPAGPWTIGGPIGDAGATGRKLVCDAYGPQIPIGGGNTHGKDGTKIDSSGAKALRIIAQELLAEDIQTIKEVFIELGYIIGQPEPCSINVITGNKAHDKKLYDMLINDYDLTPRGLMKIIEKHKEDDEHDN